jgi:hypothetical protein
MHCCGFIPNRDAHASKLNGIRPSGNMDPPAAGTNGGYVRLSTPGHCEDVGVRRNPHAGDARPTLPGNRRHVFRL